MESSYSDLPDAMTCGIYTIITYVLRLVAKKMILDIIPNP